MYEYLKSIIDSKENVFVLSFSGIWGLIHSFVVIDVVTTWQFIISGTMSLVWVFVTMYVGMAAKKFFTWSSPKIASFTSILIVNIKTKCKNVKRKSNGRAA
jgi:hypothetical protein